MVSTVNMALVFGSYYSVVVSFPTLLEDEYGFNMVQIGLAYLAPGECSQDPDTHLGADGT